MPARTVFVTGTDTEVGKTHVSLALIAALRQMGHLVAGYKPVACGDRNDAEALLAASSPDPQLTINDVNPFWYYSPMAPSAAGVLENRNVDSTALETIFRKLTERFDWVIIEGAGGWETPLSATQRFSDLAAVFGAPVMIVAPNRLGVLNHTLLTADAIAARGLPLLGVILNDVKAPDPENPGLAESTNLEQLRCLLPETPVEGFEHGSAEISAPFLDAILSGR
jgi:dethiobiotin synthetase